MDKVESEQYIALVSHAHGACCFRIKLNPNKEFQQTVIEIVEKQCSEKGLKRYALELFDHLGCNVDLTITNIFH